jgi:hypothetical protein
MRRIDEILAAVRQTSTAPIRSEVGRAENVSFSECDPLLARDSNNALQPDIRDTALVIYLGFSTHTESPFPQF